MRRFVTPALLLAAVVAGCGKTDSSSSAQSSSAPSSESSRKTPEAAWRAMRDAFLAKDAKALMATLSAESRKDLVEAVGKPNAERIAKATDEEVRKVANDLKLTTADVKAMDAEAWAVLTLQRLTEDEDERKRMEGTTWKEARVGATKAVAVTVKPDGEEDREALVLEDGAWKIDKKESSRLRAGGAEALDAPPPSPGLQKSPEEAWRAMIEVIRARDEKAFWNCLCRKTRLSATEGEGAKNLDQLRQLPDEKLEEAVKQWGLTARQVRRMSNEEIVIASLGAIMRDEKSREDALGSKWKGATVTGDTAVATTVKPDGSEEKLALVREDGTWKVDMEETVRLKN